MNNFGRKAELDIGGNIIKYNELDFDFQIHFDTTSNGNTGKITIYNLSDSSLSNINKNVDISLKAGYRENFGRLIKATITEIDNKFESVDRETTLTISENINEWMKEGINKTWSKNTKASSIAKDIINNSKLSVGEIDLAQDVKYTRAKTFSTTNQKALQEIASDTNSKLHTHAGKAYLRPLDKDSTKIYKLNAKNGLLYAPQKMGKNNNENERWKIQSLLRYEFKPDDIVKVESEKISGEFRIEDGRHVGNKNDWLTVLECVKK